MRARWPVGVGCAALALLFGSVRAAPAQDLSRKSSAAAAGPCPTEQLPPPVSAAARTQAARLGTAATEAAILGEEARARSLLEQATALDPASAPLAAQLARLLESTGEEKGAVAAYCRYLALRPGAEDAGDVRDRIRMLAAAAAPPKTVASATPRAPKPAATTAAATPPATPPARVATKAPADSQTAALAGRTSGATDRKPAAEGATVPKTGQTTAAPPPRTGPVAPASRIDTAAAMRSPRRGSVAGPALIVPGLTQMVNGRPVVGVLFLGAAAGGVALGVLDKKVHVDCLSEPVGGVCPAGQARASRTERPLLGAGLGIAGAALVIGAIEALVTGRPLPAADAVGGSGPDASGHNPRLEVGVGPRAARVGISIATRSF